MKATIELRGKDDVAGVRNGSQILQCGTSDTSGVGDSERFGELPAFEDGFSISANRGGEVQIYCTCTCNEAQNKKDGYLQRHDEIRLIGSGSL